MLAFIDSNLLVKVLFPNRKDVLERRQVKTILKKYNIKHNIISLVESARNYRISKYKRDKLHQLIGNDPIVPDNADWRLSHYILLQWVVNERVRDKHRIRKMQMDCLLASMAINRNYCVVTHDSDFDYLRRTDNGKRLTIFKP